VATESGDDEAAVALIAYDYLQPAARSDPAEEEPLFIAARCGLTPIRAVDGPQHIRLRAGELRMAVGTEDRLPPFGGQLDASSIGILGRTENGHDLVWTST
jgi:hypothetical protein